MCNNLKPTQLGRGGKALSRDVINTRVEYYIENKLHTTKKKLKVSDRQDIIIVLVEKFEYNVPELMKLLGRSRSVIYQDIGNAYFFQKRFKSRKEHADNIYSYILYNAKYIS